MIWLLLKPYVFTARGFGTGIGDGLSGYGDGNETGDGTGDGMGQVYTSGGGFYYGKGHGSAYRLGRANGNGGAI
jgi:hypothetical protein